LSSFNQIPMDKIGRPVRVINSNIALDKMLTNIYKDQLVVEEKEPDDLTVQMVDIEAVNAEAERIIAEANEKANSIIRDAMEKSAQIKNDALEKGIANGRQIGYEEGYQKGSHEFDEKSKELDAKAKKLEQQYQDELTSLEPELLNVILDVIDKVFRVQFSRKRELLLYLIHNTISKIEMANNFEVHVAESQRDYIEKHKDEIIQKVGSNMKIDIISDPTIMEDDCTIITETGVFECGFGAQLDNLIRDFRSLVR